MTRTDSNKQAAYHHGDLRRSLVESALAILSERQGWDFSLREVARRAGVSHNAPYAHFAGKQELLAALAIAGFDTLRRNMLAAAAIAPGASDALLAIGQAYAVFGSENPAHYRLMFGPTLIGEDATSRDVAAAAATTRAVLGDTIRRGAVDGVFSVDLADEGDIAAASVATWALVHGLTMLHIDRLVAAETTLRLEELVAVVSARFRKGISSSSPGSRGIDEPQADLCEPI